MNKITAILLFVTIVIGMSLFVAGNLMQIPDTNIYWSAVVGLVFIGVFLVVPLAILRLLRTA